MNNKSVPAFPSPGGVHSGISDRDYFAAHAPEMPRWFSETRFCVDAGEKLVLLAEWRWAYADAMIAGRGE